MQNPTQRGITKESSPMNAALPVEEAYIILTDALSTTEMKLTQHACYAEQLKRMYYTSFSNVKNYSRRE
jgi:hypothetical protein